MRLFSFRPPHFRSVIPNAFDPVFAPPPLFYGSFPDFPNPSFLGKNQVRFRGRSRRLFPFLSRTLVLL